MKVEVNHSYGSCMNLINEHSNSLHQVEESKRTWISVPALPLTDLRQVTAFQVPHVSDERFEKLPFCFNIQ